MATHRARVSCHVVRDGNGLLKCVLSCCGTASREFCRLQVHQGPGAMVPCRTHGPVSLPVLQTTSSQGCILTVRKSLGDFCADAEGTWLGSCLSQYCPIPKMHWNPLRQHMVIIIQDKFPYSIIFTVNRTWENKIMVGCCNFSLV